MIHFLKPEEGLISGGGGGGLITGRKKLFETSYSSVDRNTKYIKLRPVNSSLYSNTTVKQLKSYFKGILQ